MIARLVACGLCLGVLAVSAARAADATFVAEGLADPGHLGVRTTGKSPQEIEALLLDKAVMDAVSYLGAYTRGVTFAQAATADGRYAFVPGAPQFQRLGELSAEKKVLRMLKSGLALAEVTYGPESIAYLDLPKDYSALPLYRVTGEYQNPDYALSKINLHRLAVNDAYHKALVAALAKLYPGQEIVYVRGRVFPVRTVEAELVPVGGAAPASASPAGAAPATGTAAASSAAPARSAVRAEAAPPFDSRQFIYRVEMDVRIRLDEVKFAEAASGTSAASAAGVSSAAGAKSAASATSAGPGAAAASATSAVSATSAAGAAAR